MDHPRHETERWFADNVQPHGPMLRGWLQSRFPELAPDLDDIVQEAYVRVLAAKAKGKLQTPKAFFFAIARNLAIDHVRHRQLARLESLEGNAEFSVLEDNDNVAETAARNHEIEIMTEALQSLPERCRQIMTLRNVYGISQKDVAARLGISVRTVEAQVTIGIRRCTEFVRHKQRVPSR